MSCIKLNLNDFTYTLKKILCNTTRLDIKRTHRAFWPFSSQSLAYLWPLTGKEMQALLAQDLLFQPWTCEQKFTYLLQSFKWKYILTIISYQDYQFNSHMSMLKFNTVLSVNRICNCISCIRIYQCIGCYIFYQFISCNPFKLAYLLSVSSSLSASVYVSIVKVESMCY